jgi:hypothetical protein
MRRGKQRRVERRGCGIDHLVTTYFFFSVSLQSTYLHLPLPSPVSKCESITFKSSWQAKEVWFFSFQWGGGEVDGVFWNLVIYFVPNMVPKFPISSHCVFNSSTFLSHILCLKFYSCNLCK